MTQDEQAREFSRRRNLPHVEVRYMPWRRGQTVSLSRCGVDLGSKTEATARGKVTSVTYYLPATERS